MCGISCLISNVNKPTHLHQLFDDCQKQIIRRGPDYYKTDEVIINNIKIQQSASILWLQGETITHQPINTNQSFFCYNGDIFGGQAISKDNSVTKGDTKIFLENLETLTTNIIEVLGHIQGPYAFIYFDKLDSRIYFGRDYFGRRSLLIAADKDNDAYLITSVAIKTDIPMIEVPAIGIFEYDFAERVMILQPWSKKHNNFDQKFKSMETLIQQPIGIISNNSEIQNNKEINHVNINLFKEIKSKTPEEAFKYLLEDDNWRKNVMELNSKLEVALNNRIQTQPKFCKNCISARTECKHCRVGILFSGGLDCTILALIADRFIEKNIPIDLLNVAFDKVQDYLTPDRITGLQSLEELKQLRPDRTWNFVSINVTSAELNSARTEIIADLIFPLNTILDDSLGCALWFASRGKSSTYETPCRVLLVGTGADELFGGYTRHRAAMKKGGLEGLNQALDDDWANIAHRNLARDDRVIADHGRQLRTPYLDEGVVRFVQSLQVWEKTYPSSELVQGVGEKILLRTLAYHLGLRGVAGFKKRALQFGSRIADKKENAHEISPRL